MYLDPKKYNLNSRVLIEEKSPGHIAIVVKRKSRVIMKDGVRLLAQAKAIQKTTPNIKVSLETYAPICSKTKTFLLSKNINRIIK